VAWTDDSRYQLFPADGGVWAWRRLHEAMDPSCLNGTMQAGGGSILVLGVFTWHGLGPLLHLNMSLTSDCYFALLAD
jgi:hypothetical protein